MGGRRAGRLLARRAAQGLLLQAAGCCARPQHPPTHPPFLSCSALPRSYTHLLVDEFQDCNALQLRIVEALQGGRGGGRLTVVSLAAGRPTDARRRLEPGPACLPPPPPPAPALLHTWLPARGAVLPLTARAAAAAAASAAAGGRRPAVHLRLQGLHARRV